MTSFAPLRGTDLVDCARANGKKGIEVAAQRCGYGHDLVTFERELRQACDGLGIEISGFEDLISDQKRDQNSGVEVGPDSPTRR